MDYNLVLKFKKYPENKPVNEEDYSTFGGNLPISCITIVKSNNGKCSLHELKYIPKSDTFGANSSLETVVAFAYKPHYSKIAGTLNSTQETILVAKSYLHKLEESHEWLSCLQEAGVDNWCGYDEAINIKNALYDDED